MRLRLQDGGRSAGGAGGKTRADQKTGGQMRDPRAVSRRSDSMAPVSAQCRWNDQVASEFPACITPFCATRRADGRRRPPTPPDPMALSRRRRAASPDSPDCPRRRRRLAAEPRRLLVLPCRRHRPLASASSCFAGRMLGFWIYLVVFALTVVWALWERGFNGWAQVPRLAAPDHPPRAPAACHPGAAPAGP